MTTEVCLTVDVEDWYDGMAVLGQDLPRPPGAQSGLSGLCDRLGPVNDEPTVTLFVVGNYAASVHPELEDLVARGNEIASHGPDHGRCPRIRRSWSTGCAGVGDAGGSHTTPGQGVPVARGSMSRAVWA